MRITTYYCDLCKKELKQKSDIRVYTAYTYKLKDWESIVNEICEECFFDLGFSIKEDVVFPLWSKHRYEVVRDNSLYKENGFKNLFKKILNKKEK